MSSAPSRLEVEHLHRLMMQASVEAATLDRRHAEESRRDALSGVVRQWNDSADALLASVTRAGQELLRDGTPHDQLARLTDRLKEIKGRVRSFDLEGDFEHVVAHWNGLGLELAQLSGGQRDGLVRLLQSHKPRIDAVTAELSRARKNEGLPQEAYRKLRDLQAQRDRAREKYERLRQKYLEAERDHHQGLGHEQAQPGAREHRTQGAALPHKSPVIVRLPDAKKHETRPRILGAHEHRGLLPAQHDTGRPSLASMPPPPLRTTLPANRPHAGALPATAGHKAGSPGPRPAGALPAGVRHQPGNHTTGRGQTGAHPAHGSAAAHRPAATPTAHGSTGAHHPTKPHQPTTAHRPSPPRPSTSAHPAAHAPAAPRHPTAPRAPPGSGPAAHHALQHATRAIAPASFTPRHAARTGPNAPRVRVERIERVAAYATGQDGIGRGAQSAHLLVRIENLGEGLAVAGTAAISLGAGCRLEVAPSIHLLSSAPGQPVRGKVSLALHASGGRLGSLQPRAALEAAKSAARAAAPQVAAKLGAIGQQVERAIAGVLEDAAAKIFAHAQPGAQPGRQPAHHGRPAQHGSHHQRHALGDLLHDSRTAHHDKHRLHHLVDRDHHHRDSVASRLESTLSTLATASHRTLTDANAGELRSNLARLDSIIARIRGKAGDDLVHGAQEIRQILSQMGRLANAAGASTHVAQFRKLMDERRSQLVRIAGEAKKKAAAEALKQHGLLPQMPAPHVLGEQQLEALRRKIPGLDHLLGHASRAQLAHQLGRTEHAARTAHALRPHGPHIEQGHALGTGALGGGFRSLGGAHLGGFGGGHRGALATLTGQGSAIAKALAQNVAAAVHKEPARAGQAFAQLSRQGKGTPLQHLADAFEVRARHGRPAARKPAVNRLQQVFEKHLEQPAPVQPIAAAASAAQRGHGLPVSRLPSHFVAARGHSHLYQAVSTFDALVAGGAKPRFSLFGSLLKKASSVAHSVTHAASSALSAVTRTASKATSAATALASQAVRAGISTVRAGAHAVASGVRSAVNRGAGLARSVAHGVASAARGAGNLVHRVADGVHHAVDRAGHRISGALHRAGGAISHAAHGLADATSHAGQALWGRATSFARTAWNAARKAPGQLAHLAHNGLDLLRGGASWAARQAGRAWDATRQGVSGFVHAAGNKIHSGIEWLHKTGVVGAVKGAVRTGLSAIKTAAQYTPLGEAARLYGAFRKGGIKGVLSDVKSQASSAWAGIQKGYKATAKFLQSPAGQLLVTGLSLAATFIPGGLVVKTLVGAGIGLVQGISEGKDLKGILLSTGAGAISGALPIANLAKLGKYAPVVKMVAGGAVNGIKSALEGSSPLEIARDTLGGAVDTLEPGAFKFLTGGKRFGMVGKVLGNKSLSKAERKLVENSRVTKAVVGGLEKVMENRAGRRIVGGLEKVAGRTGSFIAKHSDQINKVDKLVNRAHYGWEITEGLAKFGSEALPDEWAEKAEWLHKKMEGANSYIDWTMSGLAMVRSGGNLRRRRSASFEEEHGATHGNFREWAEKTGHRKSMRERMSEGWHEFAHGNRTEIEHERLERRHAEHVRKEHERQSVELHVDKNGNRHWGVHTPEAMRDAAFYAARREQKHARREERHAKHEEAHGWKAAQQKLRKAFTTPEGVEQEHEAYFVNKADLRQEERETMLEGMEKALKALEHAHSEKEREAALEKLKELYGEAPKFDYPHKKQRAVLKEVEEALSGKKEGGGEEGGHEHGAHEGGHEHGAHEGGHEHGAHEGAGGEHAEVPHRVPRLSQRHRPATTPLQHATHLALPHHRAHPLHQALHPAHGGAHPAVHGGIHHLPAGEHHAGVPHHEAQHHHAATQHFARRMAHHTSPGNQQNLLRRALEAAHAHHVQHVERVHGKPPPGHPAAHDPHIARHVGRPHAPNALVHGPMNAPAPARLARDVRQFGADALHAGRDLAHAFQDPRHLVQNAGRLFQDGKHLWNDGKQILADLFGHHGSPAAQPHQAAPPPAPVAPHAAPQAHGFTEADIAQVVHGAMGWVTRFGKVVSEAVKEISASMQAGDAHAASNRVLGVSVTSEQVRSEVTRAVQVSAKYPALAKEAATARTHYLEIRGHFFSFVKSLHGLAGKADLGPDAGRYPDLQALGNEIASLRVKVDALGELKHGDTPMKGAVDELKKEASALRGKLGHARAQHAKDAAAMPIVQDLSAKLSGIFSALSGHGSASNVAKGDKELGLPPAPSPRPAPKPAKGKHTHVAVDDILGALAGEEHGRIYVDRGAARGDADHHDHQNIDPAALDTWIGSGEGVKLFSEVFGAFLPAEGAAVVHHHGGHGHGGHQAHGGHHAQHGGHHAQHGGHHAQHGGHHAQHGAHHAQHGGHHAQHGGHHAQHGGQHAQHGAHHGAHGAHHGAHGAHHPQHGAHHGAHGAHHPQHGAHHGAHGAHHAQHGAHHAQHGAHAPHAARGAHHTRQQHHRRRAGSLLGRLGHLIPKHVSGFFANLFDHLHGFADRIASFAHHGAELLGRGMHLAEMGMHGLGVIEKASAKVQAVAGKAEGLLGRMGLNRLAGVAGSVGGAAGFVDKEAHLLHGGLKTVDQWLGKGKQAAGDLESGARKAGGIFDEASHARFGQLVSLFKASRSGDGVDGNLNPEKVRLGSMLDEPKRLDLGTVSRMEQFLGGTFTGVRIHTGPGAAQVTSRFNAEAVTVKDHIFFAPGRYNPQSMEGQKLIAHELTHVLQKGRPNLDVRTAEGEALESERTFGAPQMETLNLSQPSAGFKFSDGEGMGSANGVHTAKRNRSRGHETGGRDQLPDGEEYLEAIASRVHALLMEELEHSFESR